MSAFMKLFGIFKNEPELQAPATVTKADLLAVLDEVCEEQVGNCWNNNRSDPSNDAYKAMRNLINCLEIPEE